MTITITVGMDVKNGNRFYIMLIRKGEDSVLLKAVGISQKHSKISCTLHLLQLELIKISHKIRQFFERREK